MELKEKGVDASDLKVEAEVPSIVGTTLENLKEAADGEKHEHTEMYPEFSQIARKEGLDAIANRLMSIARAEEHHEERYRKLIANIEAETMFKKFEEKAWLCRKCGYEHSGLQAPEECPACGHPQGYYQVKQEDF
jgi:rubrerythrin